VVARSKRDADDWDIKTLEAITFDHLLASEQVVWMYFLRVAIHIGQLAVTMEGITDVK